MNKKKRLQTIAEDDMLWKEFLRTTTHSLHPLTIHSIIMLHIIIMIYRKFFVVLRLSGIGGGSRDGVPRSK
jgi:hypothetical protein